MAVCYGITLAISIALLIACAKWYRKENSWLMWLFVTVAITDFGYFLLSVSPNLSLALAGNTIAYFGSVFLSMFVILIIAELLKINIPKRLIIVLCVVAMVIFIIATSAPYSDVYYVDVAMDKINGSTVLVKTYGILHPVYKIYIILYLITMIGLLIYSFFRKTNRNIGMSLYLSFLVAINIGIWLSETVLKSKFEFLSISYILTEILLLIFFGVIRRLLNEQENAAQAKKNDIPIKEEDIKSICENISGYESLTNREKQVLPLILEGKMRKEIADELSITESTAKKHCSAIYKKLEVENKKELLERVKSEI